MSLKEPQKTRINLSQITNGEMDYNGEPLAIYNGYLYNGYVVLSRYTNGNVKSEIEYRDGSRKGWENEYNQNGILTYSCLTFGELSIEIYKYDNNGNLMDHWKTVSNEYYYEVVKKFNLLDSTL